MLELRNLTKYYRNVPVVDHVCFEIRRGEVTGYLGPNGSGKSTTVKMLVGLLEPTTGQILLDGRDIHEDLIAYKKQLGYVPEEAHVYSYLSGLEYLQLTARLRCLPEADSDRKANELLRLFSLHPHRYTPISAYSKGMKQRVLLSAALLHDPDFLVFDEPLSGLDIASALLFKHLLSELALQGKAILYISHVLEVVERVCAKVIIIYKGRIMANDSVSNLSGLMKLPNLEAIFSELVQQDDMEQIARGIVDVMKG